MPTGEVIRYEGKRGYGFICPDEGGPDVFLHVKQLLPGQDPNRLRTGVTVQFDMAQADKGLKALRVRMVPGDNRPQPVQNSVDDGECDVLSMGEFNAEVHSLVEEHMLNFRKDLTRLVQKHGWVE